MSDRVPVDLTVRDMTDEELIAFIADKIELDDDEARTRALQMYAALLIAADRSLRLDHEDGATIAVRELGGDSFDFDVTVRFVPKVTPPASPARRTWVSSVRSVWR